MTHWKELQLGEAIEVGHGFAFKGEYFSDHGDLVVLTPGNFNEQGGFKIKPGKEKYYSGPVPPGYLLSKGDVVVAMTEQAPGLLGSTATIPTDDRYLHNQRLGLIRITDPDKLNIRFCYHLLNTPPVRQQIQATATGTKVKHTAPGRIKEARANVPDLTTQRLIAEILDAIDELIENNLMRIDLLDNIAKAIYREWYIEFRSGSQGRVLRDSETAPEGWKQSRLSSIAHITMGQSPESKYYSRDAVGKPFHQGVTDFGRFYPTHRKYSSADPRSASAGDILVSVRAPVGRLNISFDEITIGRGLAAVRSLSGRQAILFRALSDVVFSEEDSMGGGTIFKAIGKQELADVEVMIAPDDVEAIAETVFRDNQELIKSLTFTTRSLDSIRNLLRPRLISGRAQVANTAIK